MFKNIFFSCPAFRKHLKNCAQKKLGGEKEKKNGDKAETTEDKKVKYRTEKDKKKKKRKHMDQIFDLPSLSHRDEEESYLSFRGGRELPRLHHRARSRQVHYLCHKLKLHNKRKLYSVREERGSGTMLPGKVIKKEVTVRKGEEVLRRISKS